MTSANPHRSPTAETVGDIAGADLPRRIVALLAVVALLAACGLPGDEQVTTYNASELPDVLTNTTTTSTSTTTTAPPSTITPPTGDETTTTIPPVQTSTAEVYYTLGFSDDMQRTTLNLPFFPISIRQLVAQLESPPPEVAGFNLRTALRPGLVVDVVLERGTATVELSQDVLNRMTSSQERRAIAQLVLTLTSFVTPEEGAIGLVRFTVELEPIPVFLPAVGGDSEPGEPVAFSDFGVLVSPAPATTTTSTTTTTTTTTLAGETDGDTAAANAP